MLRHRFGTVGMLLAAALLATSLFAAFSPAAHADERCWLEKVETEDGIEWVERCEDSGGDDGGEDDGDSGSGEPQCDLSVYDHVHDGATKWCKGDIACWGNFPSVLPEEMWEDQTGEPRPSPDHIMTFVECEDFPDGGEWGWYLPPEETGPSAWDLAWRAFGSLVTPPFEPAFSPPTRSVVNLDTWYWADGPGSDALTGSSGRVTAIAEPSHLQVDPGDGAKMLTCGFETAENERCTHTYRQASVGHPDGFPVRMRLVYDVRFEENGSPLELDGLPTSLESAWEQAGLPVAEVQALVTR